MSFLLTTSAMDVSAATTDQNTPTSNKPNQNTVVVISDSTARRPAAAEARKRRKEILSKQHKLPLRMEEDVSSASIQLTENLVAVAAAAAAAGLDLGSAAASTTAVEDTVVVPTPEVVDPSSLDIPFLDDSAIAATAAAVAMNSSQSELSGGTKRAEKKLRKTAAASRKHPRVETDDDYASEDDDTDEMKRNKKTQIRYDPSIPMEKEQLAAWRREARRVRNRESAAASRQRIRGRITELEDEINDWKQKYEDAVLQLARFQQGATTTGEPEAQV
jgi:bZIP transcription factor